MTAKMFTIGLLITTTVLLIVWDVYAALNPERDDTISEVVLEFARQHPVIAFVLGVLMGHLLWPQQ